MTGARSGRYHWQYPTNPGPSNQEARANHSRPALSTQTQCCPNPTSLAQHFAFENTVGSILSQDDHKCRRAHFFSQKQHASQRFRVELPPPPHLVPQRGCGEGVELLDMCGTVRVAGSEELRARTKTNPSPGRTCGVLWTKIQSGEQSGLVLINSYRNISCYELNNPFPQKPSLPTGYPGLIATIRQARFPTFSPRTSNCRHEFPSMNLRTECFRY